jgi:hypothetical protein
MAPDALALRAPGAASARRARPPRREPRRRRAAARAPRGSEPARTPGAAGAGRARSLRATPLGAVRARASRDEAGPHRKSLVARARRSRHVAGRGRPLGGAPARARASAPVGRRASPWEDETAHRDGARAGRIPGAPLSRGARSLSPRASTAAGTGAHRCAPPLLRTLASSSSRSPRPSPGELACRWVQWQRNRRASARSRQAPSTPMTGVSTIVGTRRQAQAAATVNDPGREPPNLRAWIGRVTVGRGRCSRPAPCRARGRCS